MRLPKGVGFHYSLVARRLGVELDEQALNVAFLAAWKVMPPRAATMAHRTDDDRGWWRSLVDTVLDSVPIHQDLDRDSFFADVYTHFTEPGVWELYPEVLDVLTGLRAHYRLGIISNFDGRLRTILSHFGIMDLFDVVALSSEIGADKPDPFLFKEALKAANLDAAEAVHVGDDPIQDWEGAAAVGIRCFQLTRPDNSLLELAAFLEASVPATALP